MGFLIELMIPFPHSELTESLKFGFKHFFILSWKSQKDKAHLATLILKPHYRKIETQKFNTFLSNEYRTKTNVTYYFLFKSSSNK